MKGRVISIIVVLVVLFGIAGCAGGANGDQDVAEDNTATDSSQDSADSGGPTGEDQGGGGTAGSEGSNAPSFLLEDMEGYLIALTDFEGQVVVLNFWASWCPPCRQEMPSLNELDQELKESGGAVFITANLTDGRRETRETATQYIEENGFGFTVLFDEQGLLAAEYRVSSIPQTFILDREGNTAHTIFGATDKEAILEKIHGL